MDMAYKNDERSRTNKKKKEDSDIGGSTAQEKIGQREVNDHDELNGILTASMHP